MGAGYNAFVALFQPKRDIDGKTSYGKASWWRTNTHYNWPMRYILDGRLVSLELVLKWVFSPPYCLEPLP